VGGGSGAHGQRRGRSKCIDPWKEYPTHLRLRRKNDPVAPKPRSTSESDIRQNRAGR